MTLICPRNANSLGFFTPTVRSKIAVCPYELIGPRPSKLNGSDIPPDGWLLVDGGLSEESFELVEADIQFVGALAVG
jgi:hypothetical protein